MSLIDDIYQAGVVGAGGAGFPTHVKYNCQAEYLIINGAECEPLLMTDKYLMRNFTEEILDAVHIVAENIKAEKIVFALKKKYKDEIACLQEISKKKNYNIEFFLMESFYPAGDEQIMVYEITGRTVPEGGIPIDVGAVVTNVGTLKNTYFALEKKPVTDKYVSVLGEVNNPSIIKVPIGTPVKKCIEIVGGNRIEEYSVILGGPMMGKNYGQKEVEEVAITKRDGAVIVVPKDHFIIKRNKQSIEHIKNQAKAACIQCRMCTDFCPRFLIGHELEPHKIMRALAYSDDEEVLKSAQLCCECGICELYACPMGLSPRLVNVHYKNKISEKYESQKESYQAPPMRDFRKIPTDRQIARIDLSEYKHQQIAENIKGSIDIVEIKLIQHIGAPAVKIVSVGDKVNKGDLIAEAKENSLSINIHASIKGEVVFADDDQIIIKKSEVVS
ncbi:4Fe-4S dicluster domain-containing protein [Halanaerobium congolense]|jgi:Na+-translocating ferredoxin:NAD+ oxidoreductase RnfC subunit|uniref:Na+-translocating ferredoxin:NAD+ oxidoreductase RNF, RnfC subunit n=2 Tax=Halanaerobium TaxID=2330 RepID=A0A1G6L6I9_9FIRM|nr:4Fe-4S dicluster domain-containing protein [Halanaerobium congolense]PXV64780.1 Na+-translocating ferredoxin:NAD+ oxidoreductase RnfC subunit [Halanaerobium congolense]TDS35356.1 Na+-translocating ferredoxin:NAD+ oxidoreductase RnfC subunit [Halanaerobium congolense]SDC38345.1 Na+-translocating ferredoxin:NAD+ oxidoreductase RNF, RnfC subunit [Halanaerobium congolense]SDK63457.1 Na+-translocating ferredoxin:NAD+ oxidoreductase RNF, RnfC subunit [Halanaerobium congolense]SDM28356.1 Na+-trans